ncbi:hypothetical protein SAMN04489732_12847 [Amycolatopsis saalfeldensis]|uniref:Uncharacterized protein n=1 Tax=Amycolatopsis saalfeldensis TaxID=394193 RepID=A0A1H8YMZ8_9PSEU|nr:hypothetical protein SAMN04489732_12847 [Amycolatopsis saalfeldensis]
MRKPGRARHSLAVITVLVVLTGAAVHLWISPGAGIALIVLGAAHLVVGALGYVWWRRRRAAECVR